VGQYLSEDMTSHDLCLLWNWAHDADFVALLDNACQSRGLSLLQITPDNLTDMLQSLQDHQIGFRAFLDRATDTDTRFIPAVQWACDHGVYCINPHEQACHTWDKAAMHRALVKAGLHAPTTIVLPPHEEQPTPRPIDLSSLGGSFTIKPAHGGGGAGVVTQATSLSQVLTARQQFSTDKYLLQAHIVPVQLDSRPAWFRVIYCTGQVHPCWWDTTTHIYAPVTDADETRYGLAPLRQTTAAIARVAQLELFSTEIALTSDGIFVVVDYVNDQLDLRLQSKAADGVPDDIVRDVAERLTARVAAHLPPGDFLDKPHYHSTMDIPG
jgi:hypothetical protein